MNDHHEFQPVAPAGIACQECGMGRHHPWHEDEDDETATGVDKRHDPGHD